jgi:hypothetical protein
MRGHRDYLVGLVQLGRVTEPDERRALWRQSMATLAAAVQGQHPVPLEGLDPTAIAASVQVAYQEGLIDQLDFLPPPAAAAATYELAAALPIGRPERRDLGRRVLRLLHNGDASTFIAVATQIALGSRRALSGESVRARVALALDLPIGVSSRADALALALISQRDLEREWLTLPSTGSLPSRRLAARLLERAAREAARRAGQGDDSGLRVFTLTTVRDAWKRLLKDRESLVWRHVASARGLLSGTVPHYAARIEAHLSPELSPTEWRRAAASVAARITVEPIGSHARIMQLLDSPIMERDRGISAAILLGLPRAAETEPAIVEELLPGLIAKGGLVAIEALVDLRAERLGPRFGHDAAELSRSILRQAIDAGTETDDGQIALMQALHADLGSEEERNATLHERIAKAVLTFAERGAEAAYSEAHGLLEAAEGTVGTLLLSREEDEIGRRHAFRALRELDIALLEKATLADLLTLGRKHSSADELASIHDRIHAWLSAKEGVPIASDHPAGTRPSVLERAEMPHPTLRLRRMRAFLHLVDAQSDEGEERSAVTRGRQLDSARLLLGRVRDDAPSSLRRVVGAAAARACDALVRDDACGVSDVLLLVGHYVTGRTDVETFAEATMVPEIEIVLRQYVYLGETMERATLDGPGERACLDAVIDLANALPVASSPRVEALRAGLLHLVHSTEAVAAATCLRSLAEGTDGRLLAPLEGAVQTLAQLSIGARRRIGEEGEVESPTVGACIRVLDFCVERALKGGRQPLAEALESAQAALPAEILPLVGAVAARVLARVAELPLDAQTRSRESFRTLVHSEAPLPAWLPPSRVVGGFYVLRMLGTGAVGSVFIALRSEDRHASEQPRFALKVPEYDGAAARTLSETEFQDLFRQEAGALLALPVHPNIARFVTFDAGARPKPILVMELVDGPTLERVLEMADLDVTRAFEILEGIADGLGAMHASGIGHLDVKPSNVILRDPDGIAGPRTPHDPVLVDFGLAGRHLRPGCATTEYGAPEIWRSVDSEEAFAPMPADVYSFACVVFEVLTRRTLFQAPSELAVVTAHVSHDGRPDPVGTLQSRKETRGVGELLERMLQQDPARRASIAAVRSELTALKHACASLSWPLGVG